MINQHANRRRVPVPAGVWVRDGRSVRAVPVSRATSSAPGDVVWLLSARVAAVGAAAILVLALGQSAAAVGALLVAAAIALPGSRRARPVLSQLPMLGAIAAVVGAPTALAVALVAPRLFGLAAPDALIVVAVAGGVLVVIVGARLATAHLRVARRVFVVGRDADVCRVRDELGSAGIAGFAVEAHMGNASERGASIGEFRDDLLVYPVGTSPDGIQATLAEGVAVDVDVLDHGSFHELAFGSVSIADLDASWFARLMRPGRRTQGRTRKRVLDLAVVIALFPIALPLVALLALMTWMRDGKAPFFVQVRTGEGGRPFTMLKLRTMRVGDSTRQSWCAQDDDRVTELGGFLRRTHLDELPQLVNVVRGEMSLVGPRPEQPQIALDLAEELPHYAWRQSVKPGLTGWAQVRCGYAGSAEGSATKLRNDLFYLKHRSLGLDVAILLETARTVVADRQYAAAPGRVEHRAHAPQTLSQTLDTTVLTTVAPASVGALEP
jgi:lipopolysaccharide/colanic/teichoic acid biosynthesis glycosyltransferase